MDRSSSRIALGGCETPAAANARGTLSRSGTALSAVGAAVAPSAIAGGAAVLPGFDDIAPRVAAVAGSVAPAAPGKTAVAAFAGLFHAAPAVGSIRFATGAAAHVVVLDGSVPAGVGQSGAAPLLVGDWFPAGAHTATAADSVESAVAVARLVRVPPGSTPADVGQRDAAVQISDDPIPADAPAARAADSVPSGAAVARCVGAVLCLIPAGAPEQRAAVAAFAVRAWSPADAPAPVAPGGCLAPRGAVPRHDSAAGGLGDLDSRLFDHDLLYGSVDPAGQIREHSPREANLELRFP